MIDDEAIIHYLELDKRLKSAIAQVFEQYPDVDFPEQQDYYTFAEWDVYEHELEAAKEKQMVSSLKREHILDPLEWECRTIGMDVMKRLPADDVWFVTDTRKFAIRKHKAPPDVSGFAMSEFIEIIQNPNLSNLKRDDHTTDIDHSEIHSEISRS